MRAVTRTMNRRCEWKRGKTEITPRLMISFRRRRSQDRVSEEDDDSGSGSETTTDGQFVNIPAKVMLHLVVGHHKSHSTGITPMPRFKIRVKTRCFKEAASSCTRSSQGKVITIKVLLQFLFRI
ncbi:hypothetical protein DPMN_191450 [Dreissena polymorpha]|uniref:Uncharacterized protein n=1 Tax=Dreissena polymorpha TaxID=45954 RepID=A0A9D4BCW0_DREPO|nr:hypothetical protein DPMN_191450 [Dreissena polymorpha]